MIREANVCAADVRHVGDLRTAFDRLRVLAHGSVEPVRRAGEQSDLAAERADNVAVRFERERKTEKAKAIDRFIHTLESRKELLAEFDPGLWIATVESVTVSGDGGMLFRFFDGTEIQG